MTRRCVVTLAALALVVGACSVPRDDNARIITDPQRNTLVPITTSNVNAPRTQAKVYFVRSTDDKLEGVMTSVKDLDADNVASPVELLQALIVDGPQERHLESRIPRSVTFQVRQGSIDNELIVILFSFEVKRMNRDALVLAFQQMVYTLTELPHVNSVQFSVNNNLYPVPLYSGDKPIGQGVRRIVDYNPDTIYTTTTLPAATTTSATTSVASTAPGGSVVPGSLAPGASAPTSGPTATSP